MTTMRKFAFETEFTADGAVVRDAPRKFSAEEVESACHAAYARGAQDAAAQAEQHAAAALWALADAAAQLLARLHDERRGLRDEAARLALAAARKIAGAALGAISVERAASAIEAAMDALRHQPRLLVRLAPESVEVLKPRIEEMARAHGYDAAILVRAQPALRTGEAAIEWADGVVTWSVDEAAARIETLIEAALAAPGT
jgi:flagellar assembly protein FliH